MSLDIFKAWIFRDNGIKILKIDVVYENLDCMVAAAGTRLVWYVMPVSPCWFVAKALGD